MTPINFPFPRSTANRAPSVCFSSSKENPRELSRLHRNAFCSVRETRKLFISTAILRTHSTASRENELVNTKGKSAHRIMSNKHQFEGVPSRLFFNAFTVCVSRSSSWRSIFEFWFRGAPKKKQECKQNEYGNKKNERTPTWQQTQAAK